PRHGLRGRGRPSCRVAVLEQDRRPPLVDAPPLREGDGGRHRGVGGGGEEGESQVTTFRRIVMGTSRLLAASILVSSLTLSGVIVYHARGTPSGRYQMQMSPGGSKLFVLD